MIAVSSLPPAPPRHPLRVSESQRQQVLIELHHRAEGGIPVHLAAWILIVGSSGIHRGHEALVVAIGLVFLLFALARLWLRRGFAERARMRYAQANALFLVLVLANGTLWGLLAAASMEWPPFVPAHDMIRLVTFAVCAGGTMTLPLVPAIRLGMPALMMAPLVIALLARLDVDSTFMAMMTMVFLGYIGKASHTVQGDYWAAVRATALLAERATQLERLSVTDALTQVHNRLYFDRRVAEEWLRAQRDGVPLTVLLLDLDRFKAINDTHGHSIGDRCLQAVARAVKRVLYRPADVLARYGGEEFVVLLVNVDAEAGALVAERMRQCLKTVAVESPHGALSLSCSIGVASALPSPAPASWHSLLARADAAMYQAKARGRDCVVVASPQEVPAAASDRLQA